MTTTTTATTAEIVERFDMTFNTGDLDAIMAQMTEDCVFVECAPGPDGERFEGQTAVRAHWAALFEALPGLVVETEDIFASGDQAAYRWILRWTDAEGNAKHVRGMDAYRVRAGKIAEKHTYIKSTPDVF